MQVHLGPEYSLFLSSLKKNFFGLVIAETINCRALNNPNTDARIMYTVNCKIRTIMTV